MAPPPVPYGKKPIAYTLNGERYYIGAEVGNYLKCHRGKLYKHYPNMWRRTATPDEKKTLHELAGGVATLSSNVMLVRCDEVDEIFTGSDEKYRGTGVKLPSTAPGAGPGTPLRQDSSSNTAHYHKSRIAHGIPTWLAESMQVDGVVPTASPISYGKGRLRGREHMFNCLDPEYLAKLQTNAAIEEELVPIKLDLDIEGVKLRDTFCYNRNEALMTPEMVAEVFCEDLDISSAIGVPIIASAIRQQIESFEQLLPIEESSDQRANIKLNINVQNENFSDTFEWDISEDTMTPEDFAKRLCVDMGLASEFPGAIACSIRGQIAYYRRTFAHHDLQLPPVSDVHPVRADGDLESFAPHFTKLTEADMEKKIRDNDRNTRRMRRLQQGAF